MVKVIYIYETIHHEKEKLHGWCYYEINYRVIFKTKVPRGRRVKYVGYCQNEYNKYYHDQFTEVMSIHCEHMPDPISKDKKYKKKVRKAFYKGGKWVYEKIGD